MSTDRVPIARPRVWLAIAAVLAAVSIAVLWPLQQVGQVCIMIHPPPPGCGAEEPRWVPLVAIGLIIAALAAAIIVYFTVDAPRTVIVALCGAMLVVLLVAGAVVALSQTGIWDPVSPPATVD